MNINNSETSEKLREIKDKWKYKSRKVQGTRQKPQQGSRTGQER